MWRRLNKVRTRVGVKRMFGVVRIRIGVKRRLNGVKNTE